MSAGRRLSGFSGTVFFLKTSLYWGGHFQNIRFHLMFFLKRNIVPGYLSNIKFVCQNVVNSGAVKRIAFFRAKAISFAFRAIAVIPSWQEPYWEYKNLTILYLTDKRF